MYKPQDILNNLAPELDAIKKASAAEFRKFEDTAMPAELRQWLVRLRLLEGVPFANLVADSELLPLESIRWFYMDRRWTDALVQGALSVGTVNSDDRTQLETQYAAIRAELDTEERNVRLNSEASRKSGGAGPISGFLLRSRAVAGWPGLHVRAFYEEPDEGDEGDYSDNLPEVQLIRLERLAPAVLLCLFDGVPKVVHIEEPRQGIQFGVLQKDVGNTRRAVIRPRDVNTSEYIDKLGGQDKTVHFRPGGSGVIDIRQLEKDLAAVTGGDTGAGDELNSGEYALQCLRFPYRQVFGAIAKPTLDSVFKATVNYSQLVSGVKKGVQ
ncbi:MAG: hypothetical protein OEZ43_07755 [Gammaproteobacteria bacterium]|nr:hypothetical protein [Gammaproteobacteria bacterium]